MRRQLGSALMLAALAPFGAHAAQDFRGLPVASVVHVFYYSADDTQRLSFEVNRNLNSSMAKVCARIFRQTRPQRGVTAILSGAACQNQSTGYDIDPTNWTSHLTAAIGIPVSEEATRQGRPLWKRSAIVRVDAKLVIVGHGDPGAAYWYPGPVCIIYAPPFVWPCLDPSGQPHFFLMKGASVGGTLGVPIFAPKRTWREASVGWGAGFEPLPV